MTTIAGFNIYGQPLMLTEGGPNGSTTVLIMEIRKLAFGTDSPLQAWRPQWQSVWGVVILIISAFQFFAMNRKRELISV